MLKFAHSLSIAFGFMVACVNGVCGSDKPAGPQYAAADSAGKICANAAKTSAARIRSSERPARPLCGVCAAQFILLAEEAPEFGAVPQPRAARIAPEAREVPHVPSALGRANPIRAPSAA